LTPFASSSVASGDVQVSLSPKEPDIVDRIFDYISTLMPDIVPRAEEVKAAVREEFAGQHAWVNKKSWREHDRQQLARKVLSMFNGRSATEVARRLGIGRATVYRILKQAGGPKES
jgi:transcriptional regulator of acetoin/glycerol metabolism